MNHIFGCPMHYGVGAPGLMNSLDYLQSFCPELDFDMQAVHKLLNLDIMHYAKVNHHFTLPAITVPPSEVSLPPEHIAKILV